jgi:hypothetical protein
MKPLVPAIGMLILFAAVVSADAQTMLPVQERQTIERIIVTVEHLTDAAFVRNGKAYCSDTAAKFLRGKWRAKETEILSVRDFIEKVGSYSSTTGKPYLIRFVDGREMPSAQFFQSLLPAGQTSCKTNYPGAQ